MLSLDPSALFRLVCLTTALAAGVVLAQTDPPVVMPADEPVAAAPETTITQPLSPQMQEIRAAIEQERLAVRELKAQLESAASEDEAMQILARIHDAKRGTQLEILRIQARYARLAGEPDAAAEIDAAIERLLAPAPAPVPQDRPLPREESAAGGR